MIPALRGLGYSIMMSFSVSLNGQAFMIAHRRLCRSRYIRLIHLVSRFKLLAGCVFSLDNVKGLPGQDTKSHLPRLRLLAVYSPEARWCLSSTNPTTLNKSHSIYRNCTPLRILSNDLCVTKYTHPSSDILLDFVLRVIFSSGRYISSSGYN